MPRGTQEIGYTVRINNTREDRPGPLIDRRARASQNKGQDGFHQTGSRTKMEIADNARMSPITNENAVLTNRIEGDYKSRKTIGRSKTTVSDAPRNLNQPDGHRTRPEEKFMDEAEERGPGNTSRPVERLRATTRMRSLDNPVSNQSTEELDLQSKVRKGVLPQRVNRSGLVVTTTERVRESNEKTRVTPEQNRHVTSNGRAPELLRNRSSNRRAPEQSLDHNLSTPVQAHHGHRNTRTLEEFDYYDSSIQSPNHQQRKINHQIDETASGDIEEFQPRLRVRTSEKVTRPSYDVRAPEGVRRSNILDRVSVPVQNSKRRTQTLEKQSSNVRTPDHVSHATRKDNGIHQTKNYRADVEQNRNSDRFLIKASENESAVTGNSRSSAYNDNIKTTSNENEKGAQKKPRHQSSHHRRDKTKAAATATSGYNQNKQQDHSYSATKENKLQPRNSTEYSNSVAVNGVHEKSSRDLKVSVVSPSSRPTLEAAPQMPPSQTTSKGIGEVRQTKTSKRRRNKEIPADQELTYPIDMTVRETILALDSFLKEQDPDAQSIASSQFTEHHELMIHHDLTGTSNF